MSLRGFDALLLNIDPLSVDLYSTIASNVLIRLPIQNREICSNYWVDDAGTYHFSPLNFQNALKNSYSQALILYGFRGEFVVIDFTDGPSCAVDALYSPNLRGAMIMQYHPTEIEKIRDKNNTTPIPLEKVVGGFFSRNDFITHPITDVQGRYLQSSFVPPPPYTGTVDKLFFAGTLHRHTPERQVLHVLRDHPDFVFIEGNIAPNGFNTRQVTKPELMDRYAQHKGMLALRGTSGFCFREFDALHGGYPLFMPPWYHVSQMEPLVDNVHYFAVEYDPTPEIFAQRIMDRFYQVRGDVELLTRVRQEGQAWFQRNAEIPVIAERIAQWVLGQLREKTIMSPSVGGVA